MSATIPLETADGPAASALAILGVLPEVEALPAEEALSAALVASLFGVPAAATTAAALACTASAALTSAELSFSWIAAGALAESCAFAAPVAVTTITGAASVVADALAVAASGRDANKLAVTSGDVAAVDSTRTAGVLAAAEAAFAAGAAAVSAASGEARSSGLIARKTGLAPESSTTGADATDGEGDGAWAAPVAAGDAAAARSSLATPTDAGLSGRSDT